MTTQRESSGLPAPTSVGVIICTYSVDRWVDFAAAVESVLPQLDHAKDLMVVVDGNPALAAMVRQRFPDCVTVENRFGRGLSGARNTGVATSPHDVVLFLDDDAVAAPGWVDAHRAAFAEPDVIGTAGVVHPAWDDGAPPGWWPEPFDWVVGCNDQRVEPSGTHIRNPTGANMGFRRLAVLEAGGFSTRLGRTAAEPLGCEETELAIRATAQNPGSRIVSIPDAICLHRVPSTRTTWKYFRSRCVAEGRSKAVVARLSGIGAATSSERAYTSKTLPIAITTAVRQGHVRRALAIVAGVCFAAAGFVPALIDQDLAEDERHSLAARVEIERTD